MARQASPNTARGREESHNRQAKAWILGDASSCGLGDGWAEGCIPHRHSSAIGWDMERM